MTPSTFRVAVNYIENKTLTFKGAYNFAYLKENNKLIFKEAEKAVDN
jgi:hypothetical protein